MQESACQLDGKVCDMQGLSYLNAYFLGHNKDNVRWVQVSPSHACMWMAAPCLLARSCSGRFHSEKTCVLCRMVRTGDLLVMHCSDMSEAL